MTLALRARRAASIACVTSAQVCGAPAPSAHRSVPAGGSTPQVTSYSYDPNGNLLSIAGPWGTRAFTYDAADHYVLLFGGVDIYGNTYGDTWTFQNGRWTQLNPTVSPSWRSAGEMVYDYQDGYVVFFGGQDLNYNPTNDTWKFLHGNWTQLTPVVSPPAIRFGAMTYDANDSYVLLFGGDLCNSGCTPYRTGFTWTFSGGNWTNRTLGLKPPAR